MKGMKEEAAWTMKNVDGKKLQSRAPRKIRTLFTLVELRLRPEIAILVAYYSYQISFRN